MMPSVLLMNEEHRYIKRMLGVMRGYCQKVLKGETVELSDFRSMIDFVRNYADQHHHGKEEEIFFGFMLEELGVLAEKLVKMGMLVEHDLGRLLIADMEAALKKVEAGDEDAKLDLVSNAMGYTYLLHRHIDKEDGVVFTFADRELSDSAKAAIEARYEAFEASEEAVNARSKYVELLESLEAKL
ncbi:hemerythrin domain-containing protein [Acidaminobacter hydrogenoformans]|uniref:Hemerythrin-like domain-containing protein n=1 Tax=Acidaminobacter hydrogenoformans DSM 2784 TaxID=1120920 RepID=A0A1G5S7V1_9FIRM|nr:hemerythrin domain-containing protein [Acidaminobacter hydrogenoformans]SCZ81699.1 Hemerythrin-like domain-containing protein [Acidaminobacter hydrogenoformans DSM 2784]